MSLCVCVEGGGGNPLGALGFCLTNQTEAGTALDHGRVVRILVCLSYCHRKSKRVLEQWRPTARQKHSYLHHQGEFQHQLFTFRSVHDSDHGGVVRNSVGQS